MSEAKGSIDWEAEWYKLREQMECREENFNEKIDALKRRFDGRECGDNVNHPKHYQGKHECIDEMIALFGVEAVKAFCKCNVYKYRFRAAAKNGQEDLDKADWYMDKLIELGGSM